VHLTGPAFNLSCRLTAYILFHALQRSSNINTASAKIQLSRSINLYNKLSSVNSLKISIAMPLVIGSTRLGNQLGKGVTGAMAACLDLTDENRE
jgi:hypothetical protein